MRLSLRKALLLLGRSRGGGFSQPRDEHPTPLAVIAVGSTESVLGFRFLGAGQPIIDPPQQWQHQQRGERRPVDHAANKEKKEPGVLRVAHETVKPGRHQAAASAMDFPPADRRQSRPADDEQLSHDVELDGSGVAPAQQKRPRVTVKTIPRALLRKDRWGGPCAAPTDRVHLLRSRAGRLPNIQSLA